MTTIMDFDPFDNNRNRPPYYWPTPLWKYSDPNAVRVQDLELEVSKLRKELEKLKTSKTVSPCSQPSQEYYEGELTIENIEPGSSIGVYDGASIALYKAYNYSLSKYPGTTLRLPWKGKEPKILVVVTSPDYRTNLKGPDQGIRDTSVLEVRKQMIWALPDRKKEGG